MNDKAARTKQTGTPVLLDGLRRLGSNYDALLCDIWGVVHNGKAPFVGAEVALKNYRTQYGPVLLLSNAPRPSHSVKARLAQIGISDDAYDTILTSGELARDMVLARIKKGQSCLHIGPEKDADLVVGIEAHLTDLDRADFILLTGMYHDTRETSDDYADMMRDWHARDLPLICANPDRQVQFGDSIIYCAGALAEIYEKAGGRVSWLGKPYPAVYTRAKEKLADLAPDLGPDLGNDRSNIPQSRILAIGDGAQTDILGANQAAIDAVFIAGGVARAHFEDHKITRKAISMFLENENVFAAAAMNHLIW